MTQNRTICVLAKNNTRHALLAEQLRQSPLYSLVDGPAQADLVVRDDHTAPLSNDHVITLPHGPLRLGDVMDKVRYALSGRTELIEATQEIPLGPFLFRPDENHLLHIASGKAIGLTDKERLLLRVLSEAPDQTLDRTTLLKKVWQYAESTETHTFETHLYRLRQKLEPYDAQSLIKADGAGNYTLVITP